MFVGKEGPTLGSP